jgi:hypothetical protein
MMKRFLLSLSTLPENWLQLPKLLLPLSAVRLNLPKNTLQWLALVGFLRFYPPGAGSGPFRRRAFARQVRFAFQLRSALFPLLPGLPFQPLAFRWCFSGHHLPAVHSVFPKENLPGRSVFQHPADLHLRRSARLPGKTVPVKDLDVFSDGLPKPKFRHPFLS